MQGNENIAEYGKDTRFQKGVVTNPAGRKPSRLKKFIKDFDVSKDDIDAILKNLLFNFSAEQLKALYHSLSRETRSNIPPELQEFVNKQGELAAGIAVLISGLMHDVKRGDMKAFNSILDRVYGKSTEKIEHNGGLQLFTISKEEQEAL